ncbi:MAG TPA: hypothetical protein VFP93_01775, partial [Gammaproteobacteria bacterium]|nr:hypothetical protein [Gammaproteobacteria bacterium]
MRFTFMQDPLTNSLAALGWNKAKQMLSAVVDATKNLIDNTKSVVSNIWNADYTQLKATQLVIYPAIKNTIVNNKNLILSAAASTLMLAVLGINARGRGFTDLLALGYYTINAAGIAFPAFVMGKCIKEVYAEIKRLIAQGVEVYEEVDDRYHQGKKNYGSVNRERLAKVIEYTDGNYWEWSDVTIKNIAKASLNLANKSLNLVNKVIKPSLNWFEKRKFVNDKVKPVLNGVVKTINYASDKVVKPSLNFSKDKVIKPGLNFAKDNVVKPGLNWVFVKPINYA